MPHDSLTRAPAARPATHAVGFVVLLGAVSLFADMTYEGARSVAGPLLVAAVLAARHDYRVAFAILLGPAVVALTLLGLARWLFPRPRDLEMPTETLATDVLPRTYWRYLAAVAFVAAGFADFPLLAYHFEKTALAPAQWIPVAYAVAMGVDGAAALLFGRLFDRYGLRTLVAATLLSAAFPPLVFSGRVYPALAGVILWGIGMGAQESILRAAVARMVPAARRGAAYGVFNAGYGLAWFLGSALMGLLYDVSIAGLVAFSVAAQLAAVPLLLRIRQELR